MRIAMLAAALLVAASTAARADFAAGLAAYDGGDYAAALAEWRPLAESGDPRAQAALAALYRYGQGVARDAAAAARWYAEAAERGHVDAQLNLGEMYAGGSGIPRDYVRAYLWLSLAAAEGRAWAGRRRDEIASLMSPAELAEARALVAAWAPRSD